MRRISVLFISALAVLLIIAGASSAKMTSNNNVMIDPYDNEGDLLTTIWDDEGEEIDVEVTSNIPVNVYILKDVDYNLGDPNYANAKVSKIGQTDVSFSYKIPDDLSYWLVIDNPNNDTANVNYRYTDLSYEQSEEAAEEVFEFMAWGMALCVIVIVVIIVVIIVIIVLLTRRKKDEAPQYPQYPQYPQQPGYPPAPPGSPPYPPSGQAPPGHPPYPPSGQQPPRY